MLQELLTHSSLCFEFVELTLTRDLVYTVCGPYKHSFHTLDILIMETPKMDNGNI